MHETCHEVIGLFLIGSDSNAELLFGCRLSSIQDNVQGRGKLLMDRCATVVGGGFVAEVRGT